MIIKLSNNATDIQILTDYLKEVDRDFGTPLSDKVDLSEFALKTLTYGHTFITKDDNRYVALATVYCNDSVNAKAFLPILSVKSAYRGKGYARQLVNAVVNISRLNEMKTLCVDSVNPVAIALYKSVGFKTIKVDESQAVRKEYMELTIQEVEQGEILRFLEEVNRDFYPKLSDKVILSDYAKKVCDRAKFIIETDKDGICGLIVFYCNDLGTKIGYISLVGVSQRRRSQGVAYRLVKTVCEYINDRQFQKVGIHSNNINAVKIYQKLGFNIVKDDERKYMEKVF